MAPIVSVDTSPLTLAAQERQDARGKRKRLDIDHEMLLPHELLASFAKRPGMLRKLIGDPGVPRLA